MANTNHLHPTSTPPAQDINSKSPKAHIINIIIIVIIVVNIGGGACVQIYYNVPAGVFIRGDKCGQRLGTSVD